MVKEKAEIRLLQIHSVDHCNYACVGCSHASPVAPKKFFSWDQYQPHLDKLAEYALVERIDITGGEPFLNKKNLLGLIQGVRSSGITKTIEVATNGYWLRDWEKYQEILENIDQFHISYHDEQHIPPQEIRDLTDMLEEKFQYNHIYIYVPQFFSEVEFFEEVVHRDYCKYCPQLLSTGVVAKCNIIGYSKFHGFNTTAPFEALKHEGIYDIHKGDAVSFQHWHDKLHLCCDFCGFYDEQDKIKTKIPHNVNLTRVDIEIMKKEPPREGILG